MGILQQSHGISGDLTDRTEELDSLEFDDIQHFLMARPPARAARYEFLNVWESVRRTRVADGPNRQGGHRKRCRVEPT